MSSSRVRLQIADGDAFIHMAAELGPVSARLLGAILRIIIALQRAKKSITP